MLCLEGCFKGSSERFFVSHAHKAVCLGECVFPERESLTEGRFSQAAAADCGRTDRRMDGCIIHAFIF